jgi:hypothetical protein
MSLVSSPAGLLPEPSTARTVLKTKAKPSNVWLRLMLLFAISLMLTACNTLSGAASCVTYRTHRFQASVNDTAETLDGYAALDQAMEAACSAYPNL